MITAIVYTSNSGYTAQYAEILHQKTKLPAYTLDQAKTVLPAQSEIMYLGWIMASNMQGYRKAAKRYQIACACGVCMGASGSQLKEVRSATKIDASIPLFTLQGGFDMNKLHGMYKLMMQVMAKTAGKGLAEKTDRTPDEDVMLDMMLHGGNYVSEENLRPVLDWYTGQQKI